MNKSILIVGQFTNNRGDQAAGVALNEALKNIVPNVKFNYLYFNTTSYIIKDSDHIHNFSLNIKKGGGYILTIYLLIYYFFRLAIDKNVRFIIDLIEQSDVVVLPPGGPYIGDLYNYRVESRKSIIALIAKSLNKKVMIYGSSMGPFRNTAKNIIRRFVLNKIDAITVRDKASYRNLHDLNLSNKNIYCGLDCFLQLDLQYDKKDLFSLYRSIGINIKKQKVVGITPIDLSWHSQWGKLPHIQENLNKTIVQIIDYLYEVHGYNVVLVSQLYGDQDDTTLCQHIKNSCKNVSKIAIIDDSFNLKQQLALFQAMDIVIGCRHHSVIFACKVLSPFISIAYEFKIISFLEELGFAGWNINVDKLSFALLRDLIVKALDNKNHLIEIIESKLPIMIKKSRIHTAILKQLISKD